MFLTKASDYKIGVALIKKSQLEIWGMKIMGVEVEQSSWCPWRMD